MGGQVQETKDRDLPPIGLAPAALAPSADGTLVFICGMLASGIGEWQPLDVLKALSAWLVADATIRFVFAQIVALELLGSSRHLGDAGVQKPRSPWTVAWPHASNALVGSGLVLVLATFIGREPLLVAASSLLCGALGALLASSDPNALRRWLKALSVTAAWLMGHSALAPLTMVSFGLALLAGAVTWVRAFTSPERRASWVFRWAWGLLVAMSLLARQPAVVAILAVGAMADLGSWKNSPQGLRGYVRWLLSLVVVALASTYWD